MLLQLTIENLAVIERLSAEFGPRLNVFTGQTGAGKSLLIEALEVLLGLRGGKGLVRPNAQEARVTGLFHLGPQTRREIADLLGEPTLPEEIVLDRRVLSGGRSVSTINGRPIASPTLREIADFLVDIHGQHDQQHLLKGKHQLRVLTAFAGAEDLQEKVRQQWRLWQELSGQIEQLAANQQAARQLAELYEFQINEIDQVNPSSEEFESLKAERSRLANAQRLRQAAAEAYALLSEAEPACLDLLRQVDALLEELTKSDPATAGFAETCRQAVAMLDELALDLARYAEQVEADPARLDEVEERLEQLRRLCRKYGSTIEEVLAYRERIAAELDSLRAQQHDLQNLNERLEEARRQYEEAAERLSAKRRKAADELAQRVAGQLAELGLEKAQFHVEVSEAPAGPSGIDAVEFMFTANPGLPARPLREVASGGELSRVMLALKTVLADDDRCSVLVFDEIDANVGGRMGEVIGRKLAAISQRHQVLCITHLPQIAAYADRHFTVQKHAAGRVTTTTVSLLTGDEQRIRELAEMIAGRRTTQVTFAQARQMLEAARAEKDTLAGSADKRPRRPARKSPAGRRKQRSRSVP